MNSVDLGVFFAMGTQFSALPLPFHHSFNLVGRGRGVSIIKLICGHGGRVDIARPGTTSLCEGKEQM